MLKIVLLSATIIGLVIIPIIGLGALAKCCWEEYKRKGDAEDIISAIISFLVVVTFSLLGVAIMLTFYESL